MQKLLNTSAIGRALEALSAFPAYKTNGSDWDQEPHLLGCTNGIVDLRTGRPVDNGVRAVSVLAPSCTQAGMLSTTVFVLGPEEGLKLLDATLGVAGALVLDRKTIVSRRFHEYATTQG